MEISGSSAFYSGLNTIQSGQSRVDQAAGKIALQVVVARATKDRVFTRAAVNAVVPPRTGHLIAIDLITTHQVEEVEHILSDLLFIADGRIAAPRSRTKCPRQESNLRTRFRKPLLYPLSYEGVLQ